MAIKTRSEERAVVTAILESDEYGSADQMAEAIIKAVWAQLQKRDWRAVSFRFRGDDDGINYGPFPSMADAERYARTLPAGEFRFPLLLPPSDPPEDKTVACECGHTKPQHVVRGRKGKEGAPGECGVIRNKLKCACDNYTPRKKGK